MLLMVYIYYIANNIDIKIKLNLWLTAPKGTTPVN